MFQKVGHLLLMTAEIKAANSDIQADCDITRTMSSIKNDTHTIIQVIDNGIIETLGRIF